MTHMQEHDFEPVQGLPEDLPEGEVLLWQGSPDWKLFAYRGLHIRALIPYFMIILIWNWAAMVSDSVSAADIALSMLTLGLAAGAALGLVGLFAWATARTTIYSITNRRIVMRYGLALPIIINLPFRMIDAVDLKVLADNPQANGTGDVAVKIASGERVAYLVLWPHAKPFTYSHAQPMFRAIPNAQKVAHLLVDALVTTGVASGYAGMAMPRPINAQALVAA
jgi:hypothetical protein